MTEPQVWTIIGLFFAMFVSMLTITHTAFIRVLRAEIGGLRSELKSDIASLEALMDAKFNALESRMDTKLDALDRDVQVLMRREWGDPPS